MCRRPQAIFRRSGLKISGQPVPEPRRGVLEPDKIVVAAEGLFVKIQYAQPVFPNDEWQTELVSGLES